MSGNELKTKCLALVLVCIGSIFITSCSQPKRYTVYIYNPSADALTVYIDNESISVPADSTIKRSLEEGKHLLKTGDVTDTLKVSERKVLINPTRSKVIKKEILYQNEVFGKGKASAEDYFTPLKTIIIDSLRYGGHFVFTDDVMIYNWFFTIGEPIKESVGAEYSGWSKDGIKSSSYKLYSLDELARTTTPLNYDKSYIDFIVNQNLTTQANPTYIFANAGDLLAGDSKDNIGSMGKIHITNDNKIYLEELYWYNEKEHGKITDTIYMITDCIVKYDDGKVAQGKEVHLVKTVDSVPLRVVVK